MIYQLFLGRWQSASLLNHENRVLRQLIEYDWDTLRSLGYTAVYLLGLFETSSSYRIDNEEGQDLRNQPHRLASPFAVTDHRKISPRLGSRNDLKSLISQIKAAGLIVIVDFVPNHRSLSHVWKQTHPDYFVHDAKGLLVREFSGDVIKLDYSNPEVVNQMIYTLEYIARLGVDGVRCDVAHLVPDSFWKNAITHIKKQYPTFIFIGEVYSQTPFDLDHYHRFTALGFDYLYHSELFHNINRLIQGQISLDAFVSHLNFLSLQPYRTHLLHYVANHDDFIYELATFREASIGLILLLSGMPLIYNGSLEGLNRRLSHHYYDELSHKYTTVQLIPNKIRMLLSFRQRCNQQLTSFASKNNLLCGYSDSGLSEYLFVANFTPKVQEIKIESISKGLIHNYHSKDSIKPGECEVFYS